MVNCYYRTQFIHWSLNISFDWIPWLSKVCPINEITTVDIDEIRCSSRQSSSLSFIGIRWFVLSVCNEMSLRRPKTCRCLSSLCVFGKESIFVGDSILFDPKSFLFDDQCWSAMDRTSIASVEKVFPWKMIRRRTSQYHRSTWLRENLENQNRWNHWATTKIARKNKSSKSSLRFFPYVDDRIRLVSLRFHHLEKFKQDYRSISPIVILMKVYIFNHWFISWTHRVWTVIRWLLMRCLSVLRSIWMNLSRIFVSFDNWSIDWSIITFINKIFSMTISIVSPWSSFFVIWLEIWINAEWRMNEYRQECPF